jgi:hypothetical protein
VMPASALTHAYRLRSSYPESPWPASVCTAVRIASSHQPAIKAVALTSLFWPCVDGQG